MQANDVLKRQQYLKQRMEQAKENGFDVDGLVWEYRIDGSMIDIYTKDFLEDCYVSIYPYFSELRIPRTDNDMKNSLLNFPHNQSCTRDMISMFLRDTLKEYFIKKIQNNNTLYLSDLTLLSKVFQKAISKQYKKLIKTEMILKSERPTKKVSHRENCARQLKLREKLHEMQSAGTASYGQSL